MTEASSAAIAAAAERLFEARRRRLATAPVRPDLPPKDLASAYAVQRINVARLVASGAVRVGRKIGLTSLAVQKQLGVDSPDFGVLFADMAYGDSVRASQLIAPRIEAEFVLRLGRDITQANLGRGELAACVEAVAVGAEIVDSATNWDIDIVDTIADNASCGGYVTGPWRAYSTDLDLPARRMRMTRDGEVVSEGSGAATLGDPLNALAWLADASIAYGDPLKAGEIVLSGALGPMQAMTPATYRIEIDGFEPLVVRAEP